MKLDKNLPLDAQNKYIPQRPEVKTLNYKYYIINSLNDGNFMGLEIDSKHKMKYFK